MATTSRLRFIILAVLVSTFGSALNATPASSSSVSLAAATLSPIAQRLRTVALFEEPLVPSKTTTIEEDQALAAAVESYKRQKNFDDFRVFEDFLSSHSDSGWRVSLLTNLGLANYHYGYFSKAISAWEDAWREGRDIEEYDAKVAVDRAIGELLRMHARLGHSDRLAKLFEEMGNRSVTGPATEAYTGAKEGLWVMQNEPGIAYLCGPKALKNILLFEKKSPEEIGFLDKVRSSPKGVTLAEVGKLAKQANQPFSLVHREGNSPIPLPALVHWKVNHFAAIVEERDGRYHVQDPTFGTDLWITQAALDAESSGYFLLPKKQTFSGFRSVDLAEASQVRGMGYTPDNDSRGTSPTSPKGHPPCSPQNQPPHKGMCGANYHSMVISLNLTDTPVGYAPPKGSPVFFTLTYNQREAYQPATFNFSNVGPKWTTNWLSYMQDDPTIAGATVTRYVAGGGSYAYTGYSSSTGTFAPETRETAQLKRIAGTTISYERRLSDGSREIYGQTDGATAYPRRIFLTQLIDPAGNAVTLNYDTSLRLTTITDALGQSTTFSYGIAGKPLLISAVTDPFGRSAQIFYDPLGRLQQIVDAVGMTSFFNYDGSGLINQMTTPYGTSNFAYGGTGNSRWLEITDPLGHTERAEFRHQAPGIPFSESKVPVGINPFNSYIDGRNTFFWDKSLYPVTHTDYTKATIKHWLHNQVSGFTSEVLESIKNPLESRVWFNYPGQSSPWLYTGTSEKPSAIGRVMDNNATQLRTNSYNAAGNLTATTDPAGNQTLYDYDTNQIDVIKIRQKSGPSTYMTVAQLTYNAQHQPLTYTDASGQVTTYTYNASGQRLTSTDALGHTTTYHYDGSGYLTSVENTNGVTIQTRTYDAVGRVASITDAGGNTLNYQYDNLNRLTRITYPDSTHYDFQWNKLDLGSVTDRLGRVTQYTYDSNRNLSTVTDPASHTTQYAYYENGLLKSITDANAGVSSWSRDIQGRVKTVTDPKGSVTTYNYDGAGRVSSIVSPDSGTTQLTYNVANALIKKIDGRNIESNYSYDWMNRITGISYPANPTENISYNYDDNSLDSYENNRLTYLQDSDGYVVFVRDAVGNVIGKINWLSSTSTSTQYGYDSTNRLESITYPSGRIVTYTRNSLGQITQVQTQDDASSPAQTVVSGVTYKPFGPLTNLTFGNGVVTTRQYDANYRLTNVQTTTTPIWKRDYSYDTAGNISAISDPAGPYSKSYGYDVLNRLTSDTNLLASSTAQYDANSNRTSWNLSGTSIPQTYAGTSNRQTSWGPLPLTTDAAGNITSTNGAAALTLAYNSTNQMKQSDDGSQITAYKYDGFGMRTTKQNSRTTHYDYMLDGKYLDSIILSSGGTADQITEYIWLDDVPIAQVKTVLNSSGSVVSRNLTYVHTDHINTPRIMSDAAKAVVWQWEGDANNMLYPLLDPDGNGVDTMLDLGFPGQIRDDETSFFYNMNRYYDPVMARYTQSDPLGLVAGLNTYAYVDGNPLSVVDPLGLLGICEDSPMGTREEQHRTKVMKENPWVGDRWEDRSVTFDPSLGFGAAFRGLTISLSMTFDVWKVHVESFDEVTYDIRWFEQEYFRICYDDCGNSISHGYITKSTEPHEEEVGRKPVITKDWLYSVGKVSLPPTP